jgi:membrane-bound serine protease (ClpP class)
MRAFGQFSRRAIVMVELRASGIIAVLCLLAFQSAAIAATPAPRVLRIGISSVIEPITAEIVARGLDRARDERYDLVILDLNTPGGLMDSMREIIEKIAASRVPVAAFVGPSGGRAASAGFFILEAADIAAMAPGSNTGAAHPVLMGSQIDSVMKQKIENDASASLRSMTVKRGRNSELAVKAVVESKSFTEREALEGRLIEFIARDDEDLVHQLDGRAITRFDGTSVTLHLANASVATYELSLRERILVAVSDPNLALILLAIGAIAIYAEFSAPGMVLPGVVGAIFALLGLSALSVLPISWLGASLLLLGAIFFVLEIKFPSHGVLQTGGAVAVVLGSLLLIDSPIPEMRIHLPTAIAVALPFAVISFFLLSIAMRARRNKLATGAASMVGEAGVAVEDLNPEGRVFAHGTYWNAISSGPVKSGEPVTVVAVDGLRVTVKSAQDKIVAQ